MPTTSSDGTIQFVDETSHKGVLASVCLPPPSITHYYGSDAHSRDQTPSSQRSNSFVFQPVQTLQNFVAEPAKNRTFSISTNTSFLPDRNNATAYSATNDYTLASAYTLDPVDQSLVQSDDWDSFDSIDPALCPSGATDFQDVHYTSKISEAIPESRLRAVTAFETSAHPQNMQLAHSSPAISYMSPQRRRPAALQLTKISTLPGNGQTRQANQIQVSETTNNIFLAQDTPTGMGWFSMTNEYSLGAMDPALSDIANQSHDNSNITDLQTPIDWHTTFFNLDAAACDVATPQLPPGYERAENFSDQL